MLSDRAMWASVALVDYLRNGVPLDDAPQDHVARSLAALMNCWRMPLDEYWERRLLETDGCYDMFLLEQAGYTGWEMVPLMNKHFAAMSNALADPSWQALRDLPNEVWKLLRCVTGMGPDDWESLPEFCRGLLNKKVICPECENADSMDRFGEPNPIDDPTTLMPSRISLVFRCPKCGTEVNFDIATSTSHEPKSAILPKRITGWVVIGLSGVFLLVLLWLLTTRPKF